MKKIIPLLLLLLTVLPLKAQFVRNEGASIQINTGTYVRSGEWTNATATSTTALSGELLLTQDLVNNGTFAGANGSWLRFVGVALQNVEGTNQVALSNLQVNNGGNHLQLQNQVLINTQLDLTNGRLFSDLATIFFSPTALNPAETNANRIIGTAVMQARPIGVGAMPTFLNATLGAGADVGNVTLTRRTGAQGIINIAGNTSIASYWTFETTAGGTRDLTLSWLSDLDNGKDLTQLQRWRTASYNTIAAPWNQVAALSDLSVRTFTQSETDLQNSWTYSDAANPLGLIRCVDNQTANTVALACTYTHSDNTWNSTVSAIVTGLTYDLTGATTASGLTTLNGAVFNLGVTTVTATAVSPTLSQSCSFTVTVSDNVNPIITCPANITVNNESPICAGTRVCYPFPTATDNCQPYSAPITGYTYLGSIGSQSYYISNVAMDYPTGLASCRANGGYMAQIGDATEDAQLRTWVTAHFAGSPAPYFVGLTDLAIEGTFVWEDCSNTGYTNWAAGEPNNWAAGGEHATTVLGNGQWNDYPSYFSFSHILELNGAYITQTAGLLPNSVFPVGTTTNTFVATDAAGNTSTCSFDVIVNQYTYIDCPANISVNGDPLICGAIVTFPMPTACDAISVVQTAGLASGSVFPDGITTNTFVATDALGNTATCSFTVTVNVPPTVVCSADISVSSDPNVCGAVVNYPLPTACASFTITQTSGLPSGSLFPVGTTINRFVVTNAAGNSVDCSFTVTVADTNSPSIVCPANISANAAIGTCEATVTYPMPTSTDECSSYITQNSLSSIFLGGNGQNGNMFDITTSSSPIEINSFSQRFDNSGTTTMLVYYKVGTYVGSETNAAAWTLLGTATVTSPSIGAVVDVPIGGLQIPAGSVYGIYITTNGTNPIVSYTNGANTYSDANLTITTGVGKSYPFGSTFSPRTWNGTINYSVAVPNTVVVSQTAGLASGAIFPVGTTTNTFVVTDLAGNTATCSFDVTVTDNQNPTIACPANISVNNDAGVCGAAVTYTAPTFADNCAGATVSQTAGLASGAIFPIGTTTNTFVVTDLAGNTATCSFDVIVTDSENPTISCPANISVNNDAGVCGATVTYPAPTFADNCAGATVSQTAGLASGAIFPVGTTTNTFIVTDLAGNTATCSFDVTVTDNQNPTITAPAALSVNADAGLCTASGVALGTPTTADNCTFAVTNNAPATFPLGNTTVTWTITDGAGNTATATQVVNVSFAGTLTYSTSTFTESTPTSGQMGNSITITTPCPIFAGANGDDFVANGWVSVTNIPAGLTAEIIKIDDQTLSFSLVGNANPHTPNENVTDLTVAFDDNAFLFGSVAANIVGSNRNDLVVDFKALVLPNLPPCPTVENLAATPLSSNSILLTWDLPNGVERVEIRSGNDFIASVLAPQNSFVVEGLNHSTLYYFQLETECGAGFSNIGTQEVAVRARTLPIAASLESVREVCGSGRVVLSVSGKTDWQGVYRWYENETDTMPIFESASGIFETPILTESKTYFVSIFELGQEGAKVPVIALVNEAYEARVLNSLSADNELLSCESFVLIQGEETAGARYAWKLNGFILGGENLPSLEAKVSGLYQFVVIRGNCMVESAPIRVRLKVAPLAAIQTQNNAVRFCLETVLSAAAQSNPDAAVSYEWSLNGTILSTSATVNALETGVYVLKVTDNLLGCFATSERRIEILNFPTSVNLTASKTAICEGESAILSVPQVAGASYYWFLDDSRLPLFGSSVEVNAGGIYKVRVFTPNAPCSVESAEFELLSYVAPDIRIAQNGNVLEATLSENVPFVWQILDRNLGTNGEFVSVSGSENQLIFTPTQNGSYRVLATYGQDCQTASRSKTFAAITLGEEEMPENQGFSIFPNPTQDRVTLRFESNQKELQVRLYDALGRELLRQTWTNAQEVSLDLGKFANAVYTLQIVSDQMQQTVKIVKE